MWAHILYDREHGTNTSKRFLTMCDKPIDYFDCLSKCIAFCYTLKKKERERNQKQKEAVSTPEFKQKISELMRGEKNPWYGKHLSEEHRRKLSESHIGIHAGEKHPMYGKKGENNPNFGSHRTEETKRRISEANKGKVFSMESRIKMSKSHKGMKTSKETREKQSKNHINNPSLSKRVLQYTKDGQFIAEYPSLSEAERKTKVSTCSISRCCSGQLKSAGGSIWKYLNEKAL